MKSNIDKLADEIERRTKDQINFSQSPPLELGILQPNGSLKLDNFPGEITGFLVCRTLMIGPTGDVLTQTQNPGKPNDGTHSHDGGTHGGHESGDGGHTHSNQAAHVHDVLIPETMRKLKPGDRVLVAWAGKIPVIVDIVLPWG